MSFPKEKSAQEVKLLEKIVVNYALPLDLAYHTIKSKLIKDEYHNQGFNERAKAIWDGKIKKYEKLLKIKGKHDGEIPDRIKEICKQTPCGYVRLLLTYIKQ